MKLTDLDTEMRAVVDERRDCAVDDCPKVAHTLVPLLIGEVHQYLVTLPLCAWHAFELDDESDDDSTFRCLDCGGPVQKLQGVVTDDCGDHAGTFYDCAGSCNVGWERSMVWEAARARLRAEHEAQP